MEPAAAVVSCVDDDCFAAAVFAEELGEYGSEALGVHAFDVVVCYSAV